jgi:hypothetical protein
MFILFIILCITIGNATQIFYLNDCSDCDSSFCASKGYDLTDGYCFDNSNKDAQCRCYSSDDIVCDIMDVNVCNQYTKCIVLDKQCVSIDLLPTTKERVCKSKRTKKYCNRKKFCVFNNNTCIIKKIKIHT